MLEGPTLSGETVLHNLLGVAVHLAIRLGTGDPYVLRRAVGRKRGTD